MGVLAAVAAYSALGTVTTSTALAIGGASLVGAAVASTELGWLGESSADTQSAVQLEVYDKASGQDTETLEAPELGSETASQKKTKKASFSTDIDTQTTSESGVNLGVSEASQVTGVKI